MPLLEIWNLPAKKELNKKPKYTLVKSKLQKHTLVLGTEALKLYKKDVQLWRIGYKLGLSATHCQNIDQGLDTLESKVRLQVMASKLIHKDEIIAENAARGIFPCDKPLKSIEPRLARKVGRPISK